MYRIMLIEDDNKLNSLILEQLKKYGYEVITINDFKKIKEAFIRINPDLVLMDINLPYFDGFYWCREIRTVSKIPILFISARGSDMDQVMGIENGGDDYITKPFSYDILLAKVKSALRRVYGEYSENIHPEILSCYGLILHLNKNQIEYNHHTIELSSKEFTLLHSLVKSINQIVSREELLENLWNDVDFIEDNTLSVNITRLRKRLEEIGIYHVIETKRGQGYMLKNNWQVNE